MPKSDSTHPVAPPVVSPSAPSPTQAENSSVPHHSNVRRPYTPISASLPQDGQSSTNPQSTGDGRSTPSEAPAAPHAAPIVGLTTDSDHGDNTVDAVHSDDDDYIVDSCDSNDESVFAGFEEDDDEAAPGFDDDDDNNNATYHSDIVGLTSLEEDMAYAHCMLEGSGLSIEFTFTDLVITIPITDLPPIQAAAFGLTDPSPIRITLQLARGYHRTSPLPVVLVCHSKHSDGRSIETSSILPHAGFPIGLKLTQATLSFLGRRWERRSDGFLSDLAILLNDRLLNAGNTCMMCDAELPFPGLKPTVCDRELCTYQLDSLGLGADLSLLDTDPQVADLLLTATVAACTDTRYQIDSPVATPTNRTNGGDVPYTTHDLAKLINAFPTADELHNAGPERVALLKAVNPHAPFVAGWVFATNRAHIVALAEEKHIKMMQTPHQFQIHTSTRTHAEKFEALRAKHGSIWAFYGSSLANWHNILRQNLKNASITPLMSTDDAYVEGIYLGTNTTTSVRFATSGKGWAGSALGPNPSFIALVEVANSSRVHRHMNSIIIASDEDCVMLRQLFVYQGTIPANVFARDIV